VRPPFRHIAALVLLLGTTLSAGQPATPAPIVQVPTFRSAVEYVEVDAVVTDRQGNPVTNLQKEDFQVLEDGKPQTIAGLSFVDLPIDRTNRVSLPGGPVPPDIQSNERPFDGRVYVMVLDDLHVGADRTTSVKVAARQFIERYLGANDLMAVTFTGRTDAVQEFTGNTRLLLNAVDTFVGGQLQSATLDKNDQYHRQIDLPAAGGSTFVDDLSDRDRGSQAESMLVTLRQVAAWLGGIHGRRKTLLLFSEGIDYDLTDLLRGPTQQPSAADAILNQIRDTLSMTARANVSIYGIDPRGLNTTAGEVTVSGFADQADPSTGVGLASLRGELSMSQASLRQLSDQSGGFAAVGTNSAAGVFERIVRDNSAYYVLAYYPPSTNPDGKFHSIEVKVNQPGLTVRARRGYAAPRAAPGTSARTATPARVGGTPAALSDAMNSLLPVSGLTIRLFAAPFKGPKRNASVMIGIEVSGDGLGRSADSKLDLSFAALDRNAKVYGAWHDALPLHAGADTRIGQTSIRVLNRLELPAGRYRLRAAAFDAEQKRVGSVVADLAVPDFDKDPIGMSGVTVSSLAGSTMTTAILDDQMKEALPAPFVALRSFAQSDELDLFAEIYDNSGKGPHKVDIVTTVLTGAGQQVFRQDVERDSTEFKGSKRAFRYMERLPLLALAPGSYVVSVEARSRLGKNPSATRQIPFQVVQARSGAPR
jgi:VWFA-related protein